jgi:hypothetical protein
LLVYGAKESLGGQSLIGEFINYIIVIEVLLGKPDDPKNRMGSAISLKNTENEKRSSELK